MKVRVASAGTGKTASLVLRYLELIASGTPLRRIAGVTFTRKAADELRVRVGQALEAVLSQGQYLDFVPPAGSQAAFREAALEVAGATLSTIHGFMAQCLRLAASALHLDPDFAMLGDWEALAWFEEEWNTLRYLAADPAHLLHGRVSDGLTEPLLHLFARRSLAEAFEPGEGEANQAFLTVYQAVYAAYEARLGARLLSPSELERKALELTRRPEALGRVLERVEVLLVDEFQDVNPLQGAFFEALEQAGLALEIVGDPKQSIYAFRDAEIEVFRRALRAGERLPPLDRTYRHSQTLVRFLNRLTEHLAAQGQGFGPEEAPPVEATRPERGRLEIHWLEGQPNLDELRRQEAWVLARRLQDLSAQTRYADMAVLVRSYQSVRFLEEAFAAARIPYVLLQGRGYYERQEVRDLYHALRAALDPRGLSLAVFLRSPFGQHTERGVLEPLTLAEIEEVLRSSEPLQALERRWPSLHERLRLIQAGLRTKAPLEALKYLIREPLMAGRAYHDFLEPRARENVDALLFYFAPRPPQSLEGLLERLELLSRQADAGDVPQSGEGVQILTVHRAKGLEWPLVAVFDLGRRNTHQERPLYLGLRSDDGPRLTQQVALPGTPLFEAFKERAKALEEEESYRLLYVAASRARDTLLLTGSVSKGRPEGWARVLEALGLGPHSKPYDRPDFLLKTWGPFPTPPAPAHSPSEQPLSSPWVSARFDLEPFPPLFSPSAYKRLEAEPLPLPDPEEGEALPGRARAIGTLVHYAIGQNWQPDNPAHLANLEAQEVMFPYGPDERAGIMEEVRALLNSYQGLLGPALPWPRDEDYPEFAVALPIGSTVWQGVIDRLYRVGGQWYLEDYKTDQEMQPEQYYFQLGVYLATLRRAWQVEPEVRLVYLRHGQVVRLEKALLEAALSEITPSEQPMMSARPEV
ncbi:MAG: UvrD-helicase domain-containing protein, partial [Meiothermus sp.]|uniref:UvrD-helicase domain-containing protein n=1 Tax=Meiothermus sp. TaxID=1955249 RepID=UPI0025E485D9|nr:UvrD-helicase domain-containing protein [Meiothermus sp.]MCS7067081.1 UvrD-helicase domain-containing protein [Meiothermus sp.]MDW8424633.1 UvrD-helicase domain-containing protein [Meiothermus sp.]